MGLEAVGIIPFPNEPTTEEVEEATALYLNEKLMKVEVDGNFYTKDKFFLINLCSTPAFTLGNLSLNSLIKFLFL